MVKKTDSAGDVDALLLDLSQAMDMSTILMSDDTLDDLLGSLDVDLDALLDAMDMSGRCPFCGE